MDTLRRFVEEEEMVRRIVYIATVEAFHSAKAAFRLDFLKTLAFSCLLINLEL